MKRICCILVSLLMLFLFSLPALADVTSDGLVFEEISENGETQYLRVKSPVSGFVSSVKIPSNVYVGVKGSGRYYQVKSVGYRAFRDCTLLTSITFASKNVSVIEEQAFSGCVKLTSISIPPYVKSIENYTFFECRNLESISFPDSLRTINQGAFKGCSKLKSLTFPGKLNTLDNNVFQGCSNVVSIQMNTSLNSIGNYCFEGCERLASIDLPYSVRSIGTHAFENCNSLISVNLPINISNVGEYAFCNCSHLKSVIFPDGKVKVSVRSHLFDGCKSLESVTLPNTIIRIYDGAFKNCTSLKTVDIPSSVDAIGASAFEGCCSLDSVTCYIEDPVLFDANAFKDISSHCVLVVPAGTREAYEAKGWTTEIFRGGIKEMPYPAAIHGITVDVDETTPWFDLTGRRVETPQRGKLYIHGSKKVLVK